MRKLFYARLALDNIRKNARTYIPYILSCVFTVAMTYILYMLPEDPGLTGTRGEVTIRSTLVLGSFVVTIFAVIFLFYTSSFLTKRRRKEFGLLNVLGMEKKHLAKMMFFETLFVGLFSAVVGLALGVALSKLVLLFLLKLLDFDVAFGLTFSLKAALITLFLFAVIFLLILLNNIRLVHFASPVELLRGDKVGEREPKAKWLLVLIGVLTLGAGYLMAVTIQNPLEALMFFFVAVVLVIIGTYCLFTAGSIAVLKLLKRNRHYYYQPEHFISVSGMMYRMKQNAVGLGNICILSTMVLVMLSATSTMFIGTESSLMGRYPREIAVQDWDLERRDDVNAVIDDWLADNGWPAENRVFYLDQIGYFPFHRFAEKAAASLGHDFADNDAGNDWPLREMPFEKPLLSPEAVYRLHGAVRPDSHTVQQEHRLPMRQPFTDFIPLQHHAFPYPPIKPGLSDSRTILLG